MHCHVLVAQPVQVEGGAVVSGAAQRAEQLSSKLFANGGFRDSAKIVKLLPRGGAGLQVKVSRRKNYGAEGEARDAAHSTKISNVRTVRAHNGVSRVHTHTLSSWFLDQWCCARR